MDIKRLILFVVLSFSILMGWDAWHRQHAPEQLATSQETDVPVAKAEAIANDVKEVGFRLTNDQTVTVETDLYKAEIATVGGDLRHLELLKHRYLLPQYLHTLFQIVLHQQQFVLMVHQVQLNCQLNLRLKI